MKKISLAAGAALLAIAGVAIAQPGGEARGDRNADTTRQQVIERTDQRFAALDADRDGRVTPEEMRQHGEQRRAQRAERMFDRLDANSDGTVTAAERRQAREQMRAQFRQRMQERRNQAQ